MSRIAHRELTRALLARAGEGAAIESARAIDWASATFEGQRHEIALTLPAAAVARFARRIGEVEFALRGHFVADIAITGRSRAEGRARLAIEALTLAGA